MTNSPYLTPRELAEIVGVSSRTIARAVDRGIIPAVRIGPHGTRRIPRDIALEAIARYSTSLHAHKFLDEVDPDRVFTRGAP